MARSDGGTLRPRAVRRGATDVASNAITFARFAAAAVPVLVNGIPGALAMAQGKPLSLTAFTVRNGKIVALDILTDPHRLAGIGLGHTPDGRPRIPGSEQAAAPGRTGSPKRTPGCFTG
ncbi:hypothetical protein K7B10_19840 [Streptomyces flavotricini]|uniref:Uncharacterized protein n=1 Tax=Streptomyces flavotricini TaxID=66888 RepID=A0ABS8E757_9ACTN|nr:hypothetical protein [Streptomyces flavotricini]MCC0097002.1 hypothetical protein [Streptomyces flavotricini]